MAQVLGIGGVFFKADDESPYGEVVRLMDIARGAGAKTLAVVTK